MIRRNAWSFRMLLVSLALLLALLALQPLLRIAVLRSARELLGSHWNIGRFESSLRHGKIALAKVTAISEEQDNAVQFEADQVVLDVNCRALAAGQVLVPRVFINGLNVRVPRVSVQSLGDVPPSDLSGVSRVERDKSLLSWLSLAKQELSCSAAENYPSMKLAQDVIQQWMSSLDEAERRATAAQERRRELVHSIDRVGENPLRNAAFYQQALAEIEQLDKVIFDVRGDIDRWRQQAEMDREAIRAAVQKDLNAAVQPVAVPDARTITTYLLDADVNERVREVVTWYGWGRQFLPTFYRPASESNIRGRQVIFQGALARPDLLVESVVFRGRAVSIDTEYQIEGAIANLSSHPSRQDHPTEIVLHTLGTSQAIVHITLDDRGGQGGECVTITSPRCAIAERKLGRTDLLAFTASSGTCHYQITIEQRAGRLEGELKLQQPAINLAPCFTQLLDSPALASLVTDAIRGIETLNVEAKLTGTWEHPQWTLQSNLGTELAERLARQLDARRLAIHQTALDRGMNALEAQLKVRYELCSISCDRIASSLQADLQELDHLRATLPSEDKRCY